MALLLRNITLSLGESEELLPDRIAARFSLRCCDLKDWTIVRKGIDARKKPRIKFVYTVRFVLADEAAFLAKHGRDPDLESAAEGERRNFPLFATGKRIAIVGTGPAGLFAALRLAESGLAPT